MYRCQRGFTLVEMIIVVFIIGVILMITLPDLRSAAEGAQEKACEANRRMISTQLDSYFLDHGHQYPAAETFLDTLVQEGYLQSTPACPAGGTYSVTYAEEGGEQTATVTCSVHESD
ncbi:comG operon protein ComGC [Bacillaceae bacterium]